MQFINKNEMADRVGIYQIENLINHKKYIGQTSDRFIERFWNHLWKLKQGIHDNKHLQNAFNKFGEDNFEFSVLHILKDSEDIDDLEHHYISLFDFEQLYNIQYGGQDRTQLGVSMSEDTKKKIGIANHFNMLGKKHSDHTKQLMSEKRNGVTQWGKCLISYEEAKKAKELLMDGFTPKETSDLLNIKYKIINGLYSNNTYKSVVVDGWDEFYKNSRKQKTLTDEQIQQIRSYNTEEYTISEIQRQTGFSRKTIKKYLN